MQTRMLVVLRSFLAYSMSTLFSMPCLADANGADSAEKLKETMRSALASKDRSALQGLYLSRGDKQQIENVISVTLSDSGKSIKSIETIRTQQPAGSYKGADGVVHTYCPVVAGAFIVTFTDGSPKSVFPYGEENGRIYLVTTC